MLGPRWRKVWRDRWTHPTRTVLVVLSIAVGVFGLGMILSMSSMLTSEMTQSYAATNPAHANVWTWGVDDEMVAACARVPGVEAAEGRIRFNLKVQVGPDQWKSLGGFCLADYDDMRLSKVWPEEGAWPPGKGEMLLERTALTWAGAEIGEMITVECPNGVVRQLRVTGTVHDVNQSTTWSDYGAGYVSRDTLAYLGMEPGYGQIMIRVAGENVTADQVATVADAVVERLDEGGFPSWGYWAPEPGGHPSDPIVEPVITMMTALGALSLGLAGFLVYNTVSAVMTQQMRQVAILKAVGARRRQVLGLYLVMVAIYGLLALLIALPLGTWAADQGVRYMAGFLNIGISGIRPPLRVYGLQALIALGTPVLAALLPVLGGCRRTVREGLQDYGLSQQGGRRSGRLLDRARFLGRPLLLSLRNTFRRRARLMMTLATLTLGGAIFVGVLSVRNSLITTLDDAISYQDQEVQLYFRRPQRIGRIVSAVQEVPGVLGVECWGYANAERVRPGGDHGPTMTLVAPPTDTRMIQAQMVRGRWLLPEDQNAVVINSNILKDEPDLDIGDEIVLQIAKGSDTVETTWVIVGITKGIMTGSLAYANYPYFSRTLGRVNRATSVLVRLEDKSLDNQMAMARTLQDHLNSRGLLVSWFRTTGQQREAVMRQLMLIVNLLLGMSLLFAMVGGLGLMGTMSINVVERTREIGVMRATGASSGHIRRIFVTEGLLIAAMSWGLASLMSMPLGRILTELLGQSVLRSPINYCFALEGLGVWLVIVLVLAALSSLQPATRASRLTVRDVLAYE